MRNSTGSEFPDKLNQAIARQRKAYYQDGLPSAAIRIDRLRRAADLLTSNREEIADALSDDYGHRSREETMIIDIFAAVQSLRFAAENVESWLKPSFHEPLAPDDPGVKSGLLNVETKTLWVPFH